MWALIGSLISTGTVAEFIAVIFQHKQEHIYPLKHNRLANHFQQLWKPALHGHRAGAVETEGVKKKSFGDSQTAAQSLSF
jgi:hypothetical protein